MPASQNTEGFNQYFDCFVFLTGVKMIPPLSIRLYCVNCRWMCLKITNDVNVYYLLSRIISK